MDPRARWAWDVIAMVAEQYTGNEEAAATLLEARGLKKTYGAREKYLEVLSDANLSLRAGEMVAIVAPSGAGKARFCIYWLR